MDSAHDRIYFRGHFFRLAGDGQHSRGFLGALVCKRVEGARIEAEPRRKVCEVVQINHKAREVRAYRLIGLSKNRQRA